MAQSTPSWPMAALGPAPCPAVSWRAVLAGAACAAALSLLLWGLVLELGLVAATPWRRGGMATGSVGLGTIVWMLLTQLVACGAGAYLAGRWRSRWSDSQADEVRFCDTVHGVLVWVISSLATLVLLGRLGSLFVDGPLPADAAPEQAGGALAHGALWFFVSLLVGALVSGLAATRGGRRRDAAHAKRLAQQSPGAGTIPVRRR